MKALDLYQHGNRLLSVLPNLDWARWSESIKTEYLQKDQRLFDERHPIQYIYFPVTCVVSLQYQFEDGDVVGYAHVGNEGLVGIHGFMGERRCVSVAVVLAKGLAYKLPIDWMENEFNTSAAFRRLLMLYLQAWLVSTSRHGVCNRKHSVEQQLSGLLLSLNDKTSGNVLSITQETLAQLLGVRREAVNSAASHLQKKGCIAYTRGQLSLLSRPSLESASCECYAWTRQQYARLMNRSLPLSGESACFTQEPSN